VAPAAAWATANEAPSRLRQRGQPAFAPAGTGSRLEARPRTLPHCEQAPARLNQAVADFPDTMSPRGVAAPHHCAVDDLRAQDTSGMRESLRLTRPVPLRVGSPSVAQRSSDTHPGQPSIGHGAVGGSWTSSPVSGRSPRRARSTHGLESEFRCD